MTSISAIKSYKNGHVSVRVNLKSMGYYSDRVTVQGRTDMSSAEARDLAKALILEADRADAKVSAKVASDARRKKWRDREVSAGRLVLIR
jgi:hypothetical protein